MALMDSRYFAYAFDPEHTARVVARPSTVLGDDPLADAWGLMALGSGPQAAARLRAPRRDVLCLGTVWRRLQDVVAGRRAAYRMVEVRSRRDGWVRAIGPDEIAPIAVDLSAVTDRAAALELRRHRYGGRVFDDAEIGVVLDYLHAA